MDLTEVIAVAKSIEMVRKEVRFIKSNTLQQLAYKNAMDPVANQQHQRY